MGKIKGFILNRRQYDKIRKNGPLSDDDVGGVGL